jgi:hypothetical protein
MLDAREHPLPMKETARSCPPAPVVEWRRSHERRPRADRGFIDEPDLSRMNRETVVAAVEEDADLGPGWS